MRQNGKEILTIALFIMVSAALWWWHAMNTVRENQLTIPVVYTGIKANIHLTPDLPDRLLIHVSENGERIRAFRKLAPELTIDLSDAFPRESGDLLITPEMLNTQLERLLPGSTVLLDTKPERIRARYTRQHSKKVPVHFAGELHTASQYQIAGEPVCQPAGVTIYGSSEQLKAVEQIETQATVFRHLKDSNLLSVSLVAPAGIRLQQDSIQLQVIAERFTEKVFTLPVRVRKQPNGTVVRLFPAQVEVTVQVGITHFQSLQDNQIDVYCDYPTDGRTLLPVEVKVHNPHVTQVRTSPGNVEYMVERGNNRKKGGKHEQ